MSDRTQTYAEIQKTLEALGLVPAGSVKELLEPPAEPVPVAESSKTAARAHSGPNPGAEGNDRKTTPGDSRRRFLMNSNSTPLDLRAGTPLDLRPDVIVHDGFLGTIGLIHVLWDPHSASSTFIKQCIDRATYLRHLLVERLSPGAADARSGYAVEVVFAMPTSAQAGSLTTPRVASVLGTTLRELVGQSTALHAIGINLWNLDASADPKSSPEIRRAFCWLLFHCYSWWPSKPTALPGATPAAAPPSTTPPACGFGALKEVSLTNFRLPGNRTLMLGAPSEAESPLHLVHGPNGSGKSSLAECFELALTHRIERIGSEDHSKVATNSTLKIPGAAATLRLEFASGDALQGKVARSGIEWITPLPGTQNPSAWPQMPACEAAAVRMDQKLADALSQSLPQRRAQLLLSAFFSHDYQQLLKGRSAENEAAKLAADFLQKLPEAVRLRFQADKAQTATGAVQVDAEKTLKELSWLSGQDLQWEQLLQMSGLASDTLPALKPVIESSLYDYVVKMGRMSVDEATAAAKKLDEGLQGVLKQWYPLRPQLEDAAKVLQNHGAGLTPAVKPSIDDPARHFNEWLELVALSDLLEQEHRLLETLNQATADGHQFSPSAQPILSGTNPPTAQARQSTLATLRGRLARHRAELAASLGRDSSVPASIIPLERLNPEALDHLAARGFFGPDLKTLDRPMSAALRQAVQDQKVQEVRGQNSAVIRIGEPSWGVAWEQQLRALSRSLAELAPRFESLNFSDLLTNLRRLRAAAETMSGVGKAAQEHLAQILKSDGPLTNAINELVALLTPARWAYQDVISKLNLDGTSEALDLQESDGVAAALRLNTAELNALALSMFLLCARLSPNPLRLIVLDDPLQNMDELTVTTVARGLGRVMRLWQEWDRGSDHPWRVLLTLHGEENIERIRTEVPSITHFLQWLTPDPESDLGSERVIVKRHQSLMPSRLQDLSALIFPAVAGS